MGDALSDAFDVQLMTGNTVLKTRHIPAVDLIVTGSMGGLLAMELLPETCRKLVLISSTARFCSGEEYPCGTHEKILRRMIDRMKRDPDEVLKEFYKNVHHPDSVISTEPDCPQDELINGLEYLLTADLRARVSAIDIPVLLMHGADDRIIPLAAAEWLQAHLPHGRLRIFPRAGHALPAHQFSEVMGAVRAFLAEG